MNLNEQSLSRVFKHFNDENTTVCIFTGFRGNKKYQENVKRNQDIAKQLKNDGYGYFFVDGHWVENKDTNPLDVSEDSIFAICTEPEKSKVFIKLCQSLANKYDQDAILVSTVKDGAYVLMKDGTTEKIGKLSVGKVGDAYTRLRDKKGRTFVFESAREDYGSGFIMKLREMSRAKSFDSFNDLQ